MQLVEIQHRRNCQQSPIRELLGGTDMELPDLDKLKKHIVTALGQALPDHSLRVSVDHPDSPNPLCFFQVDGTYFAQGSFWANNEYRIEAMNIQEATEIMNESGTVASAAEAIAIVQRFCQLTTSRGL
jgi:hypothetical protein